MHTEDIFIVHPTAEQTGALRAFIKALKIKYEVATNNNLYNPDFVAKIKKSKLQVDQGDFVRVEQKDFENFLGL